jgi:hypothetical protein
MIDLQNQSLKNIATALEYYLPRRLSFKLPYKYCFLQLIMVKRVCLVRMRESLYYSELRAQYLQDQTRCNQDLQS